MRATGKWLTGLGAASVTAIALAEQPPARVDVPTASRFTLSESRHVTAADPPRAYAPGEQPFFTAHVLLDDVRESAVAAALPGSGGADGGGDDDQPFGKGTWSLQLQGSYYDDYDNSDVTLAYGTVGVGYYFADNWAIGLQASGYDLEQRGESRGGGSFGLDLRSHVLVRDPLSVYVEAGAGVFLAGRRFPEGGTNTNFTLQGGAGVTYRLSDSTHLVGGARWFHISNARRRGRDRNPHTDGTAVYLGVMFTW